MEDDLHELVVALSPKIPLAKNYNSVLKDDAELLDDRFEMAKNED